MDGPSADRERPSAREALPIEADLESAEVELDETLLAALRRLAVTNMQDESDLEAALLPLLAPGTVRAVLAHLRHGRLGGAPHASLEEVGAVRCLVLAAFVYCMPAEQRATSTAPIGAMDCREHVLALLRALPEILAPTQGALADMLAGLRNAEGKPILDASYAAELERLASAHPEHAELFERLLAGLLESLVDAEADALQGLFITDADSPTLVATALARWLESSSASALAWAEHTFDDPATSDEIRNAISSAVARAAPVAEAAEFLGNRARTTMLGEFLTVGEREGGLVAVDQEYWDLRMLGDANSRSRRMLVSGMVKAKTDTLLAIACEDPAPEVRAQAWTTLTFAEGFVPNAGILDRLEQCWNDRKHPRLGVPTYGLISAASGALDRAGAPELRQRALSLLIEMAKDTSLNEYDRRAVLDKLKGQLPPEEFLQLSRAR
jgi:hypothetical protein